MDPQEKVNQKVPSVSAIGLPPAPISSRPVRRDTMRDQPTALGGHARIEHMIAKLRSAVLPQTIVAHDRQYQYIYARPHALAHTPAVGQERARTQEPDEAARLMA